jgi:hypothetical protein
MNSLNKPQSDSAPGGKEVTTEDGEVVLDSVTLNRLLSEVRNEEAFEPASYSSTDKRNSPIK